MCELPLTICYMPNNRMLHLTSGLKRNPGHGSKTIFFILIKIIIQQGWAEYGLLNKQYWLILYWLFFIKNWISNDLTAFYLLPGGAMV